MSTPLRLVCYRVQRSSCMKLSFANEPREYRCSASNRLISDRHAVIFRWWIFAGEYQRPRLSAYINLLPAEIIPRKCSFSARADEAARPGPVMKELARFRWNLDSRSIVGLVQLALDWNTLVFYELRGC